MSLDDPIAPFAAHDLAQVRSSLDAINLSGAQVSKTLSGAFSKAITGGRGLEKTLQNVAASLARISLRSLGSGALTSGLDGLFAGPTLGDIPVQAFAEGGIVSRPTFFGSGSGLGLMGERGAEAIVPLSRGPDGRLGLAASSERGRMQGVHVEIRANDPEAFRHSQVQIAGALARAVARGQRGL